MRKILKTGALACLIAGFSVANAAEVPLTSLTKNCKPLVNKNLKLPQPPIKGLDERTHKRLTKAQEKMAEGNYPEGIEMLKKLEAKAKDDYLRATLNIQLAYAYAQQGKQQESYPFFKKALKYGATSLPHQRVQSLRINVAGFMYSNGDKKGAVKLMEEWINNSNVDDAQAYYLLGAFYADEEVGRMKDAVCPAYFAAKTEVKPKQSYFQLLLALHWELKDVPGSATMLKALVEYFPEENRFWRQLSQVYLQLDRVKDSLAVMEMFYLRGKFDTENDYKLLSSLFSYEDVPYRSALILEEGLKKGVVKSEDKNWRNVAQNYHVSNELSRAINAYGRSAEIADDGRDYLKQAELYSDKEEWQAAVRSFDKALKKGGLDDVGRAYLRKGVALISMGRCDSAFKALDQASKYKKYRKQSNSWADYAKDRKRRNKC